MAITVNCVNCDASIKVRDEYAGSPVRCKVCGRMSRIPKKGESGTRTHLLPIPQSPGSPEDPFGLDEEAIQKQRREYKILSVKDLFSGRFDPERIEQVINVHAKRGWIVRNIVTASAAGFGLMANTRDELIILLERDV